MLQSVFKNEIEKGLVVGTYHDVKGFEFPYVFVFNLGTFDLVLKEQPKLKAKIIYMCLTRSNAYVHITSFEQTGSCEILLEAAKKIEYEEDVA